MTDIVKAKAAIDNARKEVKNVIDAEIAARSFNGLKALANADISLEKALGKLEAAAKPRAKKAKKAKAGK